MEYQNIMHVNFIESTCFYVIAITSPFATVSIIYFAYWFSKRVEKQNLLYPGIFVFEEK